jgi:hypothetical protein
MRVRKIYFGDDLLSLDICLTMLSSLLLGHVGIGVETLVAAGILVLIGIVIIMVVGSLLFFLPAVIVAGVVWFLTGSELYAGLAFLAVSVLSLTRRK